MEKIHDKMDGDGAAVVDVVVVVLSLVERQQMEASGTTPNPG